MEDGLHIAEITDVWVGRAVGGMPFTRLQLLVSGETEARQKTLGGNHAAGLLQASGLDDPRALQGTRWIVEVDHSKIDLVRPA